MLMSVGGALGTQTMHRQPHEIHLNSSAEYIWYGRSVCDAPPPCVHLLCVFWRIQFQRNAQSHICCGSCCRCVQYALVPSVVVVSERACLFSCTAYRACPLNVFTCVLSCCCLYACVHCICERALNATHARTVCVWNDAKQLRTRHSTAVSRNLATLVRFGAHTRFVWLFCRRDTQHTFSVYCQKDFTRREMFVKSLRQHTTRTPICECDYMRFAELHLVFGNLR